MLLFQIPWNKIYIDFSEWNCASKFAKQSRNENKSNKITQGKGKAAETTFWSRSNLLMLVYLWKEAKTNTIHYYSSLVNLGNVITGGTSQEKWLKHKGQVYFDAKLRMVVVRDIRFCVSMWQVSCVVLPACRHLKKGSALQANTSQKVSDLPYPKQVLGRICTSSDKKLLERITQNPDAIYTSYLPVHLPTRSDLKDYLGLFPDKRQKSQ